MLQRPIDRYNSQKHPSHCYSWNGILFKVSEITAIHNPQVLLAKLQHFGLEQLIQKIDTIHRFINNNDFKHFATNMIYSFQLTSGISIPVLENKRWKIKYVNSISTTTLVHELQQYNIQLKLQSTFQLTKQRINDSNIMENELTNNDRLTTELK